jgi:hypothetical protein
MFQGKIPELKGTIYAIAVGKDTFTKMTQKIAEYVTCQFNDASEFRMGMEQLELEPLAEPMPPNAAQCHSGQDGTMEDSSKSL